MYSKLNNQSNNQLSNQLNQKLNHQLQQNLRDMIQKNYKATEETFILLLFDDKSSLSRVISDGYKQVISAYNHQILDFNQCTEEQIFDCFAKLPTKSLVILVQSGSFRTTKARLRADLFRIGHMVIEHARLSQTADDQIENYINSLHYDTPYYIEASNKIEQLLNKNNKLTIFSSNNGNNNNNNNNNIHNNNYNNNNNSNNNLKNILTVDSAFEKAIKNTGDFTNQAIAAGGFPIGEIFSEAKELDKINGSITVFGFPAKDHTTQWCESFIVTIKDGFVVDHNGPKEFQEILAMIRAEEFDKVQVREIGFGLNRALGFDKRINEPTAFERFAGMHFSLGLKHAMYRKKYSKKIFQKYHVDIFCKVDKVLIGDTTIFENDSWVC